MKNKIPTLKKERRPSISKQKLAKKLPVGVWFDHRNIDVDITSQSLRTRLKEWPYIQTKYPNVQKVLFKVNKSDYDKLLAWSETRANNKERKRKQEAEKHEFSIADICQNIAEGMRINNVLPRCAR